MTGKTKDLLIDLTDALYEKKAILIIGNSGVGKTYIAKKVANFLGEKKYNLFQSDEAAQININIISCHNSVTYEDIIGGISVDTNNGGLSFEYKDKILIKMLLDAKRDFETNKDSRYIFIMDDIQRNDMTSLMGDAIEILGAESTKKKISLNNGKSLEVPPNFYLIATYNPSENGAICLNKEFLSKFYIKEIISDITYITEDLSSENSIVYNQTRDLILNHLDMQYKGSTYEQNRFMPGHGYFLGDKLSYKIKYQLIPLLRQYVVEGVLEKNSQKLINLIEYTCNDKIKQIENNIQKDCFSNYAEHITKEKFVAEDQTSTPLENLIGRMIEQKLLSSNDLKNNILFNSQVCYRQKEIQGVTHVAWLIADELRYEKIRRGTSDGRRLYNGGTIKIDDKEYHFTGGMQPKEYTVKNPNIKKEIWEIKEPYEIGESTSPNVILYRIVWMYYNTLQMNLKNYIDKNQDDYNKNMLLSYINIEWNDFLEKFKKIKPQGNSNATIKAENNKIANYEVRKLIGQLSVLWKNPGDKLKASDGSEIILEGVEKEMETVMYREYSDAMETLGIKQMILQGPPGTSKTYSAKAFLKYEAGNCTDEELADLQIVDYNSVDKYCSKLLNTNEEPAIAWDIVQFHPSYSYEDFIRGIEVSTKEESDSVIYKTVNKVLGNIAELAKEHTNVKFYLIIDEINRANLSTVFGELIYGLEYRMESVATPYSVNGDNRITLPNNLYIIGTMNTADKSIGGIDYAIRRRFLFFEQLPNITVIKQYKKEDGQSQLDLNEKSCRLFEYVAKIFKENYLNPEYRKEDVQIGHTYFLVDNLDKLEKRFEYQIIPILKEYYKDGIIDFEVEYSEEGFEGFLNCITGKINLGSEKNKVKHIFNKLIE